MKTAKLFVWMLVLVIPSAPFARAEEISKPAGVGELSVLYAGYPDGPREKAWMGFLAKWFSKVKSIDLRKLNGRSAADFDVVVADWTSRYKNGSYNPDAPKHGNLLGKDFRKPIIMISAVGAELTRTMQLKTDWL